MRKSVPIDKLSNYTHKFENVLFSHCLLNENKVKLWYTVLNDSIAEFDQFNTGAIKWTKNQRRNFHGAMSGRTQGNTFAV